MRMAPYYGLPDYQVAAVYSFRKQTDLAFTWLGTAYGKHDGGLSSLKYDPFLKTYATTHRNEKSCCTV